MMVSRVQKWGNSQGLRLSKHVLDLADIAIGDDVQIIVGDGQITVKKTRTRSKYDLAVPASSSLTGFVMVEQVKSVDYTIRRAKLIRRASPEFVEDVLDLIDACIR